MNDTILGHIDENTGHMDGTQARARARPSGDNSEVSQCPSVPKNGTGQLEDGTGHSALKGYTSHPTAKADRVHTTSPERRCCDGLCSQGRNCPLQDNPEPMRNSDALLMLLAVFGPWAVIGAVVAIVLAAVKP